MRDVVVTIVLAAVWFGHSTLGCLDTLDTLNWSRSLHYENQHLRLKIATTDDLGHQVVNEIFRILAQERLGYTEIDFVNEESVSVSDVIEHLKCRSERCEESPPTHLHLLVWLKAGTGAYWMESEISDHGPLGPVHHWELVKLKNDERKTPDQQGFSDVPWIVPENCLRHESRSGRYGSKPAGSSPAHLPQQVKVLQWHLRGDTVESRETVWPSPPNCEAGTVDDNVCYTDPYGAVKLAWVKLAKMSPTLNRLVSEIWFSDDEFDSLLRQVSTALAQDNKKNRTATVHQVACQWLRANRPRWLNWTLGWAEKRVLTIAGLFSHDSQSNFTSLITVARMAVGLLESDASLFRDTEYSFILNVRNVSCEIGAILTTYFQILAAAEENNLIGTIAALCPESMEALVELSTIRRQVIISPTITSARFLLQQHYEYFFRTVPSMDEAKFILLDLLRRHNWRRITVLHNKGVTFDARIFQLYDIEVTLLDEGMQEAMSFSVAYSVRFWSSPDYCPNNKSLDNLKKSNSRIFFVDYGAQGSYVILCAAYRHGMHLDAGYVWFLNPFLRGKWWLNLSQAGGTGKETDHCSSEEMTNITDWTFTIVAEPTSLWLLHSSFRRREEVSKNLTLNETDSASAAPALDYYYSAYMFDAISVLGVTLSRLLKQNPSAVSALHQPAVAKAFRDMLAWSPTDDGEESTSTSSSLSSVSSSNQTDAENSPGFQKLATYYTVCLRFSDKNERIVDNWVFKQHVTMDKVYPMELWSRSSRCQPDQSLLGLPVPERTSEVVVPTASDTSFPEVLQKYRDFKQLTVANILSNISWGSLAGPPTDGSVVYETCPIPFISETLKMGCTGGIMFLLVVLLVLCLLPVLVGTYVHYQNRLLEAERRIQRPFDELCRELAYFDMPIENIVLNRCIGQGASGQVCGGEAKKNDRWEAVAVKLLDEKNTSLEKKIDFLREARLMSSLKHENVVRLIGVSLNSLYLVMEMMLLGDLKTYLLSRRTLAKGSPHHEDVCPSTLTRMAMDIAQGLHYLHSRHFIHRDVACRNCLVGIDRVVKIGDFGLTREASETSATEVCYRFTRKSELPVRWMAPEAVLYGISTIRSDVWSYGITLYEIVTFGMFPYNELANCDVVERVSHQGVSVVDSLPPATRNTTVYDLINSCCQHQWNERLASMDEVLAVLNSCPECIQPFLTDDPPRPKARVEPVTFQPCVLSESALNNFTRPDPLANSPLRVQSLAVSRAIPASRGATAVAVQSDSQLTPLLAQNEEQRHPLHHHRHSLGERQPCNSFPTNHMAYPTVAPSGLPTLAAGQSGSNRLELLSTNQSYNEEDQVRVPLLQQRQPVTSLTGTISSSASSQCLGDNREQITARDGISWNSMPVNPQDISTGGVPVVFADQWFTPVNFTAACEVASQASTTSSVVLEDHHRTSSSSSLSAPVPDPHCRGT